MKVAALLLVSLFATLFAIPALADSITPPIMSVAFSGVMTGGFYNSPTDYDLGGSNLYLNNGCLETCTEFEVQNGVFTGRGTINFAEIAGFTNGSAAGEVFGSLGRARFNPQTDILSAVFWGKEQVAPIGGKQFPLDWYTVQGTFSENLGTGVGSLNLTKENFIGTVDTPEPSTLLSLGTGLCAIAGVFRRKLWQLQTQ